MDIYNKEISTKLEQKFKEEIKWIKGSSINNCIICQESSSKVISYNYFDAIQKDKQIKLKFISVYISPESKQKITIIQRPVDFQNFLKISVNDVDEIQFNIQASKNNSINYILDLQTKSKTSETFKSKFFTFRYSFQQITDRQDLILQQILAQKPLKKVYWNPQRQQQFYAITGQKLIKYYFNEQNQQICRFSLNQYKILQDIIDFYIWQGQQRQYYLSLLGISGNVYISKLRSLSQQIKDKIFFYRLQQERNKINWLSIKVFKTEYNKKNIILTVKSGNNYHQNQKKVLFNIYQTRISKQGCIMNLTAKSEPQYNKQSKNILFPFDSIISNSLFYLFNNTISSLNLKSILNSITHKKNSNLAKSVLETELNLKFDDGYVKFCLLQQGFVTILRQSLDKKGYNFSKIATDLIQFELQTKNLAIKINQLKGKIESQLNAKMPQQKIDSKDDLKLLKEDANQKDLQQYIKEMDKYIERSQKKIDDKQFENNRLRKIIAQKSLELKKMIDSKNEILILTEKIQQNEQQIKRIHNEQDIENEYSDKIRQLQQIVEEIKKKPIDLNQQNLQTFTNQINQQLKQISQIQQALNQIQNLSLNLNV